MLKDHIWLMMFQLDIVKEDNKNKKALDINEYNQ